MRIAVLADIHGNSWALEAVLDDLRKRSTDAVVTLGDHFWGCLDPKRTAVMLMGMKAVHISGNQDRIIVEPDEATAAHPDYAYVHGELTDEQLDWIDALPETVTLDECVLACHGSPRSDSEYLLETVTPGCVRRASQEELRERLDGVEADVVLCGHTHLPGIGTMDGRFIVNPGSVGLPAYDDDLPYPHVMEAGSCHARYAVVSKERHGWAVEWMAVAYAYEEAAVCAEQHERPDRARWIRTGRAFC